jgi:hypothetical protein
MGGQRLDMALTPGKGKCYLLHRGQGGRQGGRQGRSGRELENLPPPGLDPPIVHTLQVAISTRYVGYPNDSEN